MDGLSPIQAALGWLRPSTREALLLESYDSYWIPDYPGRCCIAGQYVDGSVPALLKSARRSWCILYDVENTCLFQKKCDIKYEVLAVPFLPGWWNIMLSWHSYGPNPLPSHPCRSSCRPSPDYISSAPLQPPSGQLSGEHGGNHHSTSKYECIWFIPNYFK